MSMSTTNLFMVYILTAYSFQIQNLKMIAAVADLIIELKKFT